MAVDISARICTSCANASVCPHKADFMAFFNNRDKVMVKCAGEEDNSRPDTSGDTLNIRVEHRYMDGPGLEETYRNLGMTSTGGQPCALPYMNCPLMRHPFDSPVYVPHQRGSGYIEPLCRNARDAQGNRMQYIAEIAPPRTNEYHAQPYPTYPGANWWNCKSCANYGVCEPQDAQDWAKLGGTIFSIFATDTIKAKIGDIVNTADIATPKDIKPDYTRSDNTVSTFTVTSETNVIIIYYSYYKPSVTPEPYQWKTMNEIRASGKTHRMEIFYNDLAYVYPSVDGIQSIDMQVQLEGVICGEINRMSKDGDIQVITGNMVPLDITDDLRTRLHEARSEQLYTNQAEMIGAEAGWTIVCDVENGLTKVFDISEGNYRQLEVIEGDKIIIGYILPASFTLDQMTLNMMNYGFDLPAKITANTVNGDKRYIRLEITVPKNDFIIQTCLVDADKVSDPETFPPIDYKTNWDNHQIAWNMEKTDVINHMDEVLSAYRPIAPRKWANGLVLDRTPAYHEDCPPSSKQIVRPFFDLLGYTTEANKRLTYHPEIQINPAFMHTYPQELRFLYTRENTVRAVWAMWTLRHSMVFDFMDAAFSASAFNFKRYEPEASEFKITVDPKISFDGVTSAPLDVRMLEMPRFLTVETNYQPNFAKVLYDEIHKMELPDNFTCRLYQLPKGTMSLQLSSSYGNELADHAPTSKMSMRVNTGSDIVITRMEAYEVSSRTAMDMPEDLEHTYILTLYPKNCAGLSIYCQNFIAYQIKVKLNPIETSATFTQSGTDMALNMTNPGIQMFDNMTGYRLSNIKPEDAKDVYLVKLDNVLALAGDKAKFYSLANTCSVEYQQIVTTTVIYDNDKTYEKLTYQVPYQSGASFEFSVPNGDSMKEIKICRENSSIPDYVFQIIDGEIVTNKAVNAELRMDNGLYVVKLWGIDRDMAIFVTMHHGDNGTVSGCSRCKGYVDTSNYEHIEWVPICKFFKP